MPLSFLAALAVAFIVQVVAYVLTPKPKGPKPDAVQQMENPTAESGRPLPVPFGTIWMKEVNILWFGDKSTKNYKVKA